MTRTPFIGFKALTTILLVWIHQGMTVEAFSSRPGRYQPLTLVPTTKMASSSNHDNDNGAVTNTPIMVVLQDKVAQFATVAAVAMTMSPLMAIAEEAEEYEYGAVNAPIGIAWAAGCLAILTALLPVALRGGEEAFEEMKERDAGKWGTGDLTSLNRRSKKK